MDTLGHTGRRSAPRSLRGRNQDEYDKADCSLDHERSAPRSRRSLSSDRRHRRGDRRQPANARASGGCKLVPHQRGGRGQLATTRARGAPCIAPGRAGMTSRRMRAPSARDRPTFPAPCTMGAWSTSARNARAQARMRPRKPPDVVGITQRLREPDAHCRSSYLPK